MTDVVKISQISTSRSLSGYSCSSCIIGDGREACITNMIACRKI
jgi:hypothetical protein